MHVGPNLRFFADFAKKMLTAAKMLVTIHKMYTFFETKLVLRTSLQKPNRSKVKVILASIKKPNIYIVK